MPPCSLLPGLMSNTPFYCRNTSLQLLHIKTIHFIPLIKYYLSREVWLHWVIYVPSTLLLVADYVCSECIAVLPSLVFIQIEERKLEEEMERKEQERLEEILAMCAQYEEQIDSEKQLASTVSTSSTKSTHPTFVSSPTSNWMGARSTGLTTSSFGQSPYNKSSTSMPSSIPG